MFEIKTTNRFETELRKCLRAGKDIELLRETLAMLAEDIELPESYHVHRLGDEYDGCWECHIEDDWLLVWKRYEKKLTLLLTNTGTHDDLFHKRK